MGDAAGDQGGFSRKDNRGRENGGWRDHDSRINPIKSAELQALLFILKRMINQGDLAYAISSLPNVFFRLMQPLAIFGV